MMIRNDKVYDVLKWVDMIVLPALASAYAGLSKIWNLPYAAEIPATITVLCALLGALLGISNATYYKENVQQGYTDFTEELEPLEEEIGEG